MKTGEQLRNEIYLSMMERYYIRIGYQSKVLGNLAFYCMKPLDKFKKSLSEIFEK